MHGRHLLLRFPKRRVILFSLKLHPIARPVTSGFLVTPSLASGDLFLCHLPTLRRAERLRESSPLLVAALPRSPRSGGGTGSTSSCMVRLWLSLVCLALLLVTDCVICRESLIRGARQLRYLNYHVIGTSLVLCLNLDRFHLMLRSFPEVSFPSSCLGCDSSQGLTSSLLAVLA